MIRIFRRCAAVLSLAASPALAQSSPPPCPPAALRYDVALQAGAVRVDVCVPGAEADTAAFEIGEFGGVETFGDNVVAISAATADGRALPVARREPNRWTVESGARSPFRLTYTIRHQKPSFMGAEEGGQFQPTLFDTWALLWGHAYVLFPAPDALKALPAGVRVDAGPYRAAFASWGADTVVADVDALRNSVLVAGDFRRQVREVEGVPITFLAQGAWSFTDQAFADAVQRVLRTQAGPMGSYPATRLSVVLVPGLPNSAGGTVVRDAIVVYPRPSADVTRDPSTLGLIAHEHFHLWNGEAAYPAPDVPEGEVKWFQEGFTDYYGELTLLRAGVVDEAALIERINGRIRDYVLNPHALTATSAVLGQRYWDSREYNRLPYVKGALVALLMDLRIRHESGGARSLDDVVRAVFTRGGAYRPADLRRMLEEATGRAWGDFLDTYVFGAGELPLLQVCAEVGMECARGPVPLFQQGFVLDGALRVGATVTSVDAGSAAERAGVRVGDVIRGASIRQDPAVEARIDVTRGPEQLTFRYLPAREIVAPRIHPTDASRRVIASLHTTPAPVPSPR